MIKNLIFLGAPGSGKGSTAAKLSSLYNIEHISTGEIFRQEIENQTELGKKFSKIVDNGDYVPDELTNEIVLKKLKNLKLLNKKFILDGYPRTINQAKFLKEVFEEEIYAVFLDLPTNLIIERLVFRRICPTCKEIYNLKNKPSNNGEFCQNHLENPTKLISRKDDSEEAIKKRLKIYNELTKPIIDFYKNENLLFEIKSLGSIAEVANLVKEKVFDGNDKK